MSAGLERSKTDAYWMGLAIEQAKLAQEIGEVPIGAVITRDGELISKGFNRSITDNDPTAHAEIIAIRQACNALNNYRIPRTTLYVTLEPCSMCIGAIIHARVDKLIFGAKDPKTGAAGGVSNLIEIEQHKHKLSEVKSGVLEESCSKILTDFFSQKREEKKQNKKKGE